jgi:hypothetical protein
MEQQQQQEVPGGYDRGGRVPKVSLFVDNWIGREVDQHLHVIHMTIDQKQKPSACPDHGRAAYA